MDNATLVKVQTPGMEEPLVGLLTKTDYTKDGTAIHRVQLYGGKIRFVFDDELVE